MRPYDKLRALRCELHVAERAINRHLILEWPLGAPISGRKGSHRYAGVVTMHSYGDSIKVRNAVTRREYWICAYDMDVEAADA